MSRSTVIVVVVAVAGVVAAVLLWRGGPATPGGPGPLPAAADVPVDAVTRVELKRAGEPEMTFRRAGAGWVQTEPFPHPMQPFSMRALVTAAAELEVVRRLERGADDDVGLDPPQAVVTYQWPGGRLALRLGRRSVAGRAYLAVAGDDTVYVVRGELHERALEHDPRTWRDRTIFGDPVADAEALVIDDGETRIELQRDQGRWWLVEPLHTRLDAEAGGELMSSLGRARFGDFILDRPQEPEKFGLADPAAELEVRWTEREQHDGEIRRRQRHRRLLVGSRVAVGAEDRFGMIEGRPVVVRLPEAVLRALFPPLSTLAARTASGVAAADVKSVLIRGSGGELELQRSLERWVAPRRGDADVDAAAVETLLHLLTASRAPEVEIRPYPREHERATVTFFGFDSAPRDTVRIAVLPDGAWALENGDDVLRLYPPETQVPLTPQQFGLPPATAANHPTR